MMSISDTLERLQGWEKPREAVHFGEKCPFLLNCHLSGTPAPKLEIEKMKMKVGSDLEEFWGRYATADLFKDETYGQWGIRIFSPSNAANVSHSERLSKPYDMFERDVIIGQFYGDSNQLMISASRGSETEFPIILKLPIDKRSEWPMIARSFSEFLENYIEAEGAKFWEF